MKQLTPISVHHSTATRHGKMWTAFMRPPHPTSHNHDPSVLFEDAAARGRFDTYLAQTTRTHTRPITFRPPRENITRPLASPPDQTGDAMFTLDSQA